MKIEERILKIRREEKSDWHSPKLGVYHASQLGDIYSGRLKAKDFFKPPKFDDKTLLTFEIGKMYHEYIQRLHDPKSCERKVVITVDTDIEIVGKVDLILDNIPCELKTCSEFPNKPHIGYEIQLNTYMEALQANKGVLTYIKKDPRIFITRNYTIKYNPLLWQSVVKKLREFHEELKVVSNEKNK